VGSLCFRFGWKLEHHGSTRRPAPPPWNDVARDQHRRGGDIGHVLADPKSVRGKIIGLYWAGNQDQFVGNVVLNANGSVTMTLGAAPAIARRTVKRIAR